MSGVICGPGCCDGCSDCYGEAIGCHREACACVLAAASPNSGDGDT